MRQEHKNRKTVVLGVLVAAVLIGVCFGCVTLYARNEINKPRFRIPESDDAPLTQTLTNKDDAFAFAMEQYTASITADNTEGSWKTEVRRLDEDWQTPFSKADDAIFSAIRKNAGEQLKKLYPEVNNARLCERTDVPQITQDAQDVLDFTLTLGRENDKKEIVDTDRYFLTLTFDPSGEDTAAMLGSETFRKIAQEIAPLAALSGTQIEMQSVTMCFEIDRACGELRAVEIRRDMLVHTTLSVTDNAAALLETRQGAVTMPYGTTEKISFLHYGAHFTEHAIAVKPGDAKALPAAVSVNGNATKADYKLTFAASEPGILSFDADGVMTVAKGQFDDPVTVTMTLVYQGRTYTDQLTVYITDLEVATDVAA